MYNISDHRNPACKRVLYDAELPSASVIIIFHNEPYSVVVRTIWSVVNSARRNQPWYRRVNYVDRNTGAKMSMGEFKFSYYKIYKFNQIKILFRATDLNDTFSRPYTL